MNKIQPSGIVHLGCLTLAASTALVSSPTHASDDQTPVIRRPTRQAIGEVIRQIVETSKKDRLWNDTLVGNGTMCSDFTAARAFVRKLDQMFRPIAPAPILSAIQGQNNAVTATAKAMLSIWPSHSDLSWRHPDLATRLWGLPNELVAKFPRDFSGITTQWKAVTKSMGDAPYAFTLSGTFVDTQLVVAKRLFPKSPKSQARVTTTVRLIGPDRWVAMSKKGRLYTRTETYHGRFEKAQHNRGHFGAAP